MDCVECGSSDTVKDGLSRGKQRYKCKDCGKKFVEGEDRHKPQEDICYVEGCNNPSHAHGLCNKHYRQRLREND